MPAPYFSKKSFHPGEQISFRITKNFSGFGVHFGPFKQHEAWKVRVENSSVGITTYAQNQIFTIDQHYYRIFSKGDETVQIIPAENGARTLIISPEHEGSIEAIDNPYQKSYKLPPWARDYWFSTPWTRMSWSEMVRDIDKAHELLLSPKVWLIDAGWASEKEYLSFDPDKFPEGAKTPQTLQELGVKPIVWIAPWIVQSEKTWQLFDKKGWFVKDPEGKSALFAVTGDGQKIGSYLDFTNTDLLAYFQERIINLIHLGVQGFMFDFGESLPDDTVFACDTPSAKEAKQTNIIGHNWYVGESKRVLHDICKDEDVAIISRSGWNDSYQHTALWLGDQSSDTSRFAGLNSLLWGYKTALESGYYEVGIDVGGYFGTPSQQDYLSWLDFSVLLPFSLLHGMSHAGPWEEGYEALQHFRDARKKHHQIWHEAKEGSDLTFKISADGQTINTVTLAGYTFHSQRAS